MMNSFNIRILENLCRTCMGEPENGIISNAMQQKAKSLISIYHVHEVNRSGNVNIMELLKQTSPQLTVEAEDLLPKNICENCLDVLVDIHAFQQNSLRIEQRLRAIIKEYYPAHNLDGDPLINKQQQSDAGEYIQLEIDEPLIDVTTPVKSYFNLIQNDGEIIKVYNEFEKRGDHISVGSEKCDTVDDVGGNWKTQFDTGESQLRNIENLKLTDVKFCKYIEVPNDDNIPAVKEQKKYEGIVNGAVNSNLLSRERKVKRLEKRRRTCRKSNKQLNDSKELSDKKNNRKQNSDDEDIIVDVWRHQATKTISNDIKNVTEDGSVIEIDVSYSNKISGKDDSEWEPHLDKSERLKYKSIKHDNKLDNKEIYNLSLKDENEELVCAKLDIRRFSCNECRKRLKTSLGLKRHLERHITNKQKQQSAKNGHVCQECGMRLKTRTTFRRHLLTHEKDETNIKKRPYLCSICGKSFKTPSSLNAHSELHSTEHKYQCPECPKRFRCRSNMATHKAIVHNTVRPHVCDVCGASFKKPYCLTKHKINHGEKKHKCDYCEMKFSHPDQCRRHMRTHTGEKPYKCRYCERSYSQSTEVMKHLRVHLGENVYRCEMCPQAFRMLCELRVHFNFHKDDDEETKFQNLKALKEEEARIQTKIESQKATEQQS